MEKYILRENPGTNEFHLFRGDSSLSLCEIIEKIKTNSTSYHYENESDARVDCAAIQNRGSQVCGGCVKVLYRT